MITTTTAVATTKTPFSISHPVSFQWLQPPPPPPTTLSTSSTTNPKPTHHSLRTHNTNSNTEPVLPSILTATTTTTTTTTVTNSDKALLFLLRQRKTEEAWQAYLQYPNLPSSQCLSRLVSQLSYQNTKKALDRAQTIIRRLRDLRQLHRLDANSLGLLAVSTAKAGHTLYATSIIKAMLQSGYLPHVKAWSAVVSRLAGSSDDGPSQAIKLFTTVTRRVRRSTLIDPSLASEARPDTAAYNGVLNACANLGDTKKFFEIFEEMPEFAAKPDVLTYNILIKLCARVDRKDLLGFVLERILNEGIVPCPTTLHSLVAAYVGFNDLETAEKMVQAMREGRLDICKILRESNTESKKRSEGSVFEMMLPIKEEEMSSHEPPLLPKAYYPDSRMYTTLMKGYMKEGRIGDVVRMLEAMRCQSEDSSRPDHVTYTTVISTYVKVGAMEKARQLLVEMAVAGVPPNRITFNVLLKGYCQHLQLDKAKELMKEMARNADIEPNVVSYNILIDGCILFDDSAGALAYFNEMRERGIAPTKVSYTTLMKAFATTGQPKLAHKVFDEMVKDHRVKVDQVAWNVLLEAYCKLGFIEEGKRIVQRMRENGFYPDVATYGSLANGIAVARKPGEALLLWNEIKGRLEKKGDEEEVASTSSSPPLPPITPDEGLLDTLADVCVRAAFFKKALEIVACMEENGIAPNKTKYTRIYVEMHSRMFTSKHASQARQDRRKDKKRAAEAFKFWLGLPNSYYGSEWRLEPDSFYTDLSV